MTFEEVDNRNQAILDAFEDWKQGNTRMLEYEVRILCECKGIRISSALYDLSYSESPNRASTRTTNRQKIKTILNTLKKLGEIQ